MNIIQTLNQKGSFTADHPVRTPSHPPSLGPDITPPPPSHIHSPGPDFLADELIGHAGALLGFPNGADQRL